MNKNILIIFGIIALLLLGVGGYVLMSKKAVPTTPNTVSQQTETTPSEQQTASSNQKSMKDLLLAGVSQKCTYKDKLDNVDMSGTAYVASGKMRTDFTSTTSGKTMTGHMIVDGTTSYTWIDGQTSGFKMKFDPNQTTPSTTTDQKQQSVDPNKAIDYSCSVWVVDGAQFTPPSNVNFTDYSSIVTPPTGGTTTPSTSGSSAACSACNSLSGEQKTQCLTALKCY